MIFLGNVNILKACVIMLYAFSFLEVYYTHELNGEVGMCLQEWRINMFTAISSFCEKIMYH